MTLRRPVNEVARFGACRAAHPFVALSVGLGLQYAMLTVASVVLTPAILIGTVGGSAAYQAWVVFAALVVSGVTTVIQDARVGRIGSGYLLWDLPSGWGSPSSSIGSSRSTCRACGAICSGTA